MQNEHNFSHHVNDTGSSPFDICHTQTWYCCANFQVNSQYRCEFALQERRQRHSWHISCLSTHRNIDSGCHKWLKFAAGFLTRLLHPILSLLQELDILIQKHWCKTANHLSGWFQYLCRWLGLQNIKKNPTRELQPHISRSGSWSKGPTNCSGTGSSCAKLIQQQPKTTKSIYAALAAYWFPRCLFSIDWTDPPCLVTQDKAFNASWNSCNNFPNTLWSTPQQLSNAWSSPLLNM